MNIDAIIKNNGGLINLAAFGKLENCEAARAEMLSHSTCGPIHYSKQWEQYCFSFYPH